MPRHSDDVSSFATALLPSLSRSLAEKFNVFRVMHHGTHEKQLSNVFAWLFAPEATHGLGNAVQRIFLGLVNDALPAEGRLPPAGYRVKQEVDTRGESEISGGEIGKDIADILLVRDDAAVIVENYETSDGHGHGFHRYREHAANAGRDAAVVLLCLRREAHLQRHGWQEAVVVTYAEVLDRLQGHISRGSSWARRHPEQHFFIQQMVQHFVEGPAAVNLDDQIAFIKTMCDTGESARYGQRFQDGAAQEFADLVAGHARQQFEGGRKTLAAVKTSLRGFARSTLMAQVNGELREGYLESVYAGFSGIWEWGIRLDRPEPHRKLFLLFGPTAARVLAQVSDSEPAPDYSRIFVTLDEESVRSPADFVQSDVRLSDVIEGLSPDDMRLRDAVLRLNSA